jgi:Protein of unknown function (DUF2911)
MKHPATAVWAACLLFLALAPVGAQRLRISPHETHRFELDGTAITFDYGRPSKRGRQIWGGLVPWGHWWMPGADEATIITTEAPLVLGGVLRVPAGRHTIYMLPEPGVSTLIVNNQLGQFHTRYDPGRDLGRVDLTLRTLDAPVEQLTFTIERASGGSGALQLAWDDREYSVTAAVAR